MNRNLVIIGSTLLGSLYFIYFYLSGTEVDAASLGTLGDFIGGNINPILTFISTILLIETVSLQRDATKSAAAQSIQAQITIEEQRLLATTQIFESSFFNLLNLCLEDVKNASITINDKEFLGSKAFAQLEASFQRQRKETCIPPAEIINDLDDLHGHLCFNTIKNFSAIFSFINESAPSGTLDKYISLTTKLTPSCIIFWICIAKLHTRWAIIAPFEAAGLFEKKGFDSLMKEYA